MNIWIMVLLALGVAILAAVAVLGLDFLSGKWFDEDGFDDAFDYEEEDQWK